MPSERRKKFSRSSVAPRLVLQHRDIALLRDVAEFRFLNTPQILALHTGGERNLMRRLSALYQHGYLDRPEVQKAARLSSAHMVYSLGRKAAEVLSKDRPERDTILRRVREVKHTSPIIAHAMMISQFHVCLTLALKKRPVVKLTRWTQGNDLKLVLSARGRKPELVPDAFFTLDDGNGAVNFFLEADRATETTERFVRKLKIYWSWKDDAKTMDALGITRFRVLTVAHSEGRAESLCAAAKNADPQKRGSLMFLFASESLYGVGNPDPILEAAWKTPKDDLLHAAIE